MEKLKIILIMGFAVTMMNSCIMEPEPCDPMIDYIIKNISEHDVELIIFYKDIDSTSRDSTFLITAGGKIKQSYVYQFVDLNYPFNLNYDSAYMDFDSVKRIIYRRNDGLARNILNAANFKEIVADECLYQYEYEITDDDYADALLVE